MQKSGNYKFNSPTLSLSAILMALILLSSCRTIKSFNYFNTLTRDTTIQAYVAPNFESKIQKNDVLGVSVSSLNSDLDLQFNTISKITSSGLKSDVETNVGFTVDDMGCIYLHFIGKIKVEGLTKSELKKKLEKELLPYLKEPIVTIQYLNKKVTILGNVQNPGIIFLSEEQIPLLQVLVKTGGLKDMTLANDIVVFRDSGDYKIVKHINLEDHSIFNSPWYFVQSDDIVYVKKDVDQYDAEERRKERQTTVSLAVSLISLLLVLINTLFK
jgi:polysaccharide export outer membrane protein